jgi:hypothetical protein
MPEPQSGETLRFLLAMALKALGHPLVVTPQEVRASWGNPPVIHLESYADPFRWELTLAPPEPTPMPEPKASLTFTPGALHDD